MQGAPFTIVTALLDSDTGVILIFQTGHRNTMKNFFYAAIIFNTIICFAWHLSLYIDIPRHILHFFSELFIIFNPFIMFLMVLNHNASLFFTIQIYILIIALNTSYMTLIRYFFTRQNYLGKFAGVCLCIPYVLIAISVIIDNFLTL